MFFNKYALLFLLFCRFVASQQEEEVVDFTYNGFGGVNMSLDGLAQITENGLLMLVRTTFTQVGHAFYPHPIWFKNNNNNSSSDNVLSFSTTFVFAMFSELSTVGGPGIVLVISPSPDFPGAFPSGYLGLFNTTNIGNSSNHLIGIELDCLQNEEFNDINGNHVGIDINDLKSVESVPASYFSDQENRRYVNLSLVDGQTLQLWVEYNGDEKQLNVTLAPINVPKPTIPLLSSKIDLSQIIIDPMFVGFSSASYVLPVSYYVLGWSFKLNGGEATELNLSQLPKLPQNTKKKSPRLFIVAFSVIGATLLLISIFVVFQFIVKRKKKFAEVLEDWELDYRPHRFKYKDLYIATKGFKDEELLGTGGFGSVYRGVLPKSKTEVAVKRVSHNSRLREREFITEIISVGKLRHRNIVPLLGYCRRKGELLLVYDFMPNGSLDNFLFDQTTTTTTTTKTRLSWCQRFQIIKNVAAALSYLHQEWEQVVVHRDVKSSNVLLDKELNGRLGDFGVARLYEHGADPQTTRVVGTLGYLAPELGRTGKANPSVDVFAFGAFLLEVACGRRPIEAEEASEERMVLVDWVISCRSRGTILDTVDPKLGRNYIVEEMELVLKLGLLCSHSIPTERPHMRQVMRYLMGEVPVPEPKFLGLRTGIEHDTIFVPSTGFCDVSIPYPNLRSCTMTRSSSVAESVLSQGR
ncbi:L-type lectin-domain containing receptor kinase IV.1-like [Telopea speciosissima]|uniref:L-type lectin-domain containing receptor kinase IV.1-like n=1 Tax=Telopea speciosissima TaxID=54955 RepID=UPI001CC3B2DA|nr:L-type lectin-domain containing receptor kinase IV.1-like [Telopea speciosissima]